MSESESTLSHALMGGMAWLSSLVYLNILWLLGVLAGGVVLGIGPATLSLCAVLREMIWNRKDLPSIGRYFFAEYRRIWKESNRFIFLFYGLYLFLWLDYGLILRFVPIIFPAYAVLAGLVFLVTAYFFVFYAVFDKPFWLKLKDSLLLPWLFPLQSLGMLGVAGTVVVVGARFPGAAVLFMVSVPFALFYYLLRKKYRRHFRG